MKIVSLVVLKRTKNNFPSKLHSLIQYHKLKEMKFHILWSKTSKKSFKIIPYLIWKHIWEFKDYETDRNSFMISQIYFKILTNYNTISFAISIFKSCSSRSVQASDSCNLILHHFGTSGDLFDLCLLLSIGSQLLRLLRFICYSLA